MAYEDDHPIGVAEFAFYRDVYNSLESAYPKHIALQRFGSFEESAGIRTIYVEPHARSRIPPCYLLLCFASCLLGHRMGVRFTTATKDANNHRLRRLYESTGGIMIGTYWDQMEAPFEVAVFLFPDYVGFGVQLLEKTYKC